MKGNSNDLGAIGCFALCGIIVILLDIYARASGFIANVRICGLLSFPFWILGVVFLFTALYKFVEGMPQQVSPTNPSVTQKPALGDTANERKTRIAEGRCPKCGSQVNITDANCPTCKINLGFARDHLDEW